ncbi:MAG: FtsX-like permease family protein [Bacteroidetes bacterium]|nr:FtsX-like permease family protein [Bacteroidota bacterium]
MRISLIRFVWAQLWQRPLQSLLYVALMTVGVGAIIALLVLSKQVEEGLTRNAAGVDLVVGAKGSPLQLVLSSVYHADVPTGNIPLAQAEQLARHPAVAWMIPLSLGDRVDGFRIVGTTPAYPARYEAQISRGQMFDASMEATIGSEVARALQVDLGDELISAHGLVQGGSDHGEHPLTVAGILAPTGTVLDRLILTSLTSVWDIHGIASDTAAVATQPLDITAALVGYRSPVAKAMFPRLVAQQPNLQPAAPSDQIVRLASLLGIGVDLLRLFALVLIAAAALGVIIALYTALRDRRYDMAVMRTLGASRLTVATTILIEGMLLVAMGLLVGWAVGHLMVELVAASVPIETAGWFSGWKIYREEGYIMLALTLLAFVISVFPALTTYRMPLADRLVQGR